MTHEHLNHGAGVSKMLLRFNVNTLSARANEKGIQIIIDKDFPTELSEYIEITTDNGSFIFGVWVKRSGASS